MTDLSPMWRLARWDGESFVPVAPGSVAAPRVFVLSHGWAPGMAPAAEAAEAAGGRLRVWDSDAVSVKGRRFDGWYQNLGNAILANDPDAAVLCFSWVDESATGTTPFDAKISLGRTFRNGLRLQWALQQALAEPGRSRLHMIGHSHGSRIVTVATIFSPHPPVHLTILDSPDETVSAMGGAANDLPMLLRTVTSTYGPDELFIDNYISQFGIRYGDRPGLHEVVDVLLTGEQPDVGVPSPNEHGYAYAWYVATAREPSCGVGFGWSRARRWPGSPHGVVLRQSEDPDADPLTLDVVAEQNARVTVTWAPEVYGKGASPVLSTAEDHPVDRHGSWFLRYPGAAFVRASVTWLEGPPEAALSVRVAGRTILRLTREQCELAGGTLLVPVMDLPAGPYRLQVGLHSPQPASVRIQPDYAVASLELPTGAEARMYIRPLYVLTTSAVTLAVGLLLSRALWRRVSRRRAAA